jgi:undecaprenyl-diphosphatase
MLNTLNEQLFFLINGVAGQSVFVDAFFIFVTKVFVPVMTLTVFIWFFVVLPKRSKDLKEKILYYKYSLLFLLLLSILFIIIESIKVFVAFPRPQELLTGVRALSTFGSYDSFPSAHTAFAFSVATFVFQYFKSMGIIFFILALLVGVSRIIVGVHFPLDVIVGAFIGFIVSFALQELFKRYSV